MSQEASENFPKETSGTLLLLLLIDPFIFSFTASRNLGIIDGHGAELEGLEYEDSGKWNEKEEGWEANTTKCNFNRGPSTSRFVGKRSITMLFKPLLFWIFVTLG